jgi:hypothetical protein
VARNEDIVNSIWEDLDDLSNDEMLLFVWSWSNPRCGMAGIYKCARRNLAEGRLEGDALAGSLAEVSRRRLLFYEDGIVWVRARYKRLRQHGKFIAKSAAGDLKTIPTDHPLYVAWMQEYARDPEFRDDLARGFAEHGVSVNLGEGLEGPYEAPSDGPSRAPQVGSVEPNDEAPSRGPVGAPGTGAGTGIGAVVDQVLARLGECAKWKRPPESDRELVERVVLDTPSANHLAAATSAVAKGDDPKWNTRTPGMTFKYAVKEQLGYTDAKPEAPKADKSKYNVHLKAASNG